MKSLSLYTAAALTLASSVTGQTNLGNFKIPRNRVCNVAAHNDGTDDTPAILAAINSCNPGGRVVFQAGNSYTVGTAMNITNLDHMDLRKYTWQMFYQTCH